MQRSLSERATECEVGHPPEVCALVGSQERSSHTVQSNAATATGSAENAMEGMPNCPSAFEPQQ